MLLRSLLSSSCPSATVISVNYRLGFPPNASRATSTKVRRFPQPIHDTSIAFNHIVDEIVPSLFPTSEGTSPTWEPHLEPRIALLGSHIGAALATMLALTHPNDVHSVATADPLVDWVILDELLRATQNPPLAARGKRSLPASSIEDPVAVASAAKQLIDVRTKLFASPSAYFDPFASPTLFLRAPGRDTPRTHAEALGMLDDEVSFNEETEADEGWEAIGGQDEYSQGAQRQQPGAGNEGDLAHLDVDADALFSKAASNDLSSVREDLDTITEAIGADSFGPYDDDHPSKSSASTAATNGTAPNTPAAATSSNARSKQPKRRKVLRRWPPLSRLEDVMLPYFNVFVSPPTSLLQEGSEDAAMDSLLRIQGIELVDLLRRACFHGREKGIGEERVKLTEFEHLEDKTVGEHGAGVHDAQREDERMKAMIEWLRWRLEGP